MGLAVAGGSACSSGGSSTAHTVVNNTPSVAPSTPASPSATPSASSGCVKGASYCDTFSDKSSGWPKENSTNFYSDYDSYLGGSYRIGERANHTATAMAPVNVPDVSQDYSIQIDVDATVGQKSPSTGRLGLFCWDHPTSDKSSDTAFVFFVGQDKAYIVLWDAFDGSPHTIASSDVSGLLTTDGSANHLTAQCIQGTKNGGPEAQLSLSVNGRPAVSVGYAKTVKNYDWSVEDGGKSGVGVIAAGTGEDVFYDNFAVTSRCQPGGTFPCPSPSATTTG